MDLQKMDPMARKMAMHSEAFIKALESGNANDAQGHINEVLKFAGYLSDDIHGAIVKAERENLQAIQVNMVRKMNQSGAKFDTAQRNDVLPGTIIPARTNLRARVHRGTFGRYQP
tara:strand:+ start:223 stop:567 length:345 start_codon:yes stop_codon:yes gene_type:complete